MSLVKEDAVKKVKQEHVQERLKWMDLKEFCMSKIIQGYKASVIVGNRNLYFCSSHVKFH
jgi:hypothetical protein